MKISALFLEKFTKMVKNHHLAMLKIVKSISWICPLILTCTKNVMGSSLNQTASFHQVSWSSVQKFLWTKLVSKLVWRSLLPLRSVATWTYLIVSTLKFPSAREKPWFSVRGSPKPNVRTERVRVRRRAMTNSRAHRVKLWQGGGGEIQVSSGCSDQHRVSAQ